MIAAARALRAPWRKPATVGAHRRRSSRGSGLLAGGRFRFVWIAVAVVGVGGGGAGTWAALRPPWAMVNGDVVTLAGSDPTVAAVMADAHVAVGPGVVYTAVTHQPIPGRTAPPAISVGGAPATLSTPVTSGAHISVRPGSVTEPVVAKHVTSGLPGTPSIWYHLWHPGKAKTSTELVGAYSGQVVRGPGPASPERAATPVTSKVVALTFDDGPDPQNTPQILHILQKEHVPATFCIIGNQAAAFPQLVHEEAAAGMTLCDHTYTHDEYLDKGTHAHIVSEIDRAAQAITSASGGKKPQFYRPPGGFLSPEVIQVANQAGLQALYWTVDTQDWRAPSTSAIVAKALTAGPGDIILMHDGGGDRSHTIAALPQIIAGLRARGFTFTTPAMLSPRPAPSGTPVPTTPVTPGME
ncbi:MAG TPA: polysaccharide deacetylase family protein [Acidimicrobiales bacterium]|nr:polysaccharide deacetylase family protein [Acidimicrobiales bacterium]